MTKKPLILVLLGPPLPRDQGYRHVAYNDVVQLSCLRNLHIVIVAEYVYDFHASHYALNRDALSQLPGVKSVTFVPVQPFWKQSLLRRLFERLTAGFHRQRSVVKDVENLKRTIDDLSRSDNCTDVHFGITDPLFIDVCSDLQKKRRYTFSFTAHNVESDLVLIRLQQHLRQRKFFKSLSNWIEYRIRLRKEFRVLRKSRLVIAIAYNDFVRYKRKGINVHFVPPLLAVVKERPAVRPLPSKPTLTVLGHLAFSAAGDGIALFLKHVVPRIKEHVPHATIQIIGRDAGSEIVEACKRLDVCYREYVEDLEELWSEITVLACPLLTVKGIRIRILEAVYRTIPVVCTREAATGFERPESCLNVTSDFDVFAYTCVQLLTDADRYEREQRRMRRYFEEELSREIIERKWNELFEMVDEVEPAVPSRMGNIEEQELVKVGSSF